MSRLLGTIWTSAFPDTNFPNIHNKRQLHVYMHIKTDILQILCYLIDYRWHSRKRNHTAWKKKLRKKDWEGQQFWNGLSLSHFLLYSRSDNVATHMHRGSFFFLPFSLNRKNYKHIFITSSWRLYYTMARMYYCVTPRIGCTEPSRCESICNEIMQDVSVKQGFGESYDW